MSIYFNLGYLKANCKQIHYFGLGFVQLKLNDSERLHFYSDKLPRTVQNEEIHNHRYNFVSEILYGNFTQEIYELTSGDTHLLTQETCKADDKREFAKVPVGIKCVFHNRYYRTDTYYIDHNTFHTVDSVNAITLVKRSEYKKEFADVIFPKDSKTICPFSIKVDENELWKIVEEMLMKAS